jgi:hypothetical protein
VASAVVARFDISLNLSLEQIAKYALKEDAAAEANTPGIDSG